MKICLTEYQDPTLFLSYFSVLERKSGPFQTFLTFILSDSTAAFLKPLIHQSEQQWKELNNT